MVTQPEFTDGLALRRCRAGPARSDRGSEGGAYPAQADGHEPRVLRRDPKVAAKRLISAAYRGRPGLFSRSRGQTNGPAQAITRSSRNTSRSAPPTTRSAWPDPERD